VSYLNSLLIIKQFPQADIVKGKMVIDQDRGFQKAKRQPKNGRHVLQSWRPPDEGEAKLNVDGAYAGTNQAGCGMLLHTHDRQVIYAACRNLTDCSSATEAELIAIEDGLKLALQWSNLRFDVETHCAEACNLIMEKGPNRSAHAFRINVIRDLLRERERE
jgi:hypothetical protein